MKMKHLFALTLIAALSVFTPGCAFTRSDSTTEQKAADVRNLSYAAASIGTQLALAENADWRGQFDSAYETLNQLVNSKIVSGALLRDVLASLPIKELKSAEARIAIEGATLLYDSTVGTSVNIENQVYVLAAATGIRDGMKVALGK